MKKYPKVLVISHNVFSKNGNMGKTMADLLDVIQEDHLAQMYFHSEVPTMKVCRRYFRITDKNILRSVFTRKGEYRIYGEADIEEEMKTSRTDTGLTAKIYQFSRKRTPMIYFLRNTMWKLGIWNTKALNEWIQEFSPDVIFFASGDYVFPYRITRWISKEYDIPVVMYCCDDHYIGRKKTFSILYHLNKRNLLKWAKCVAGLSKSIITISDKMQQDYSELFGKKTEVIRISARNNPNSLSSEERKHIVYAGNLGVNRIKPLLELGVSLKKAQISGYERIDVYSGERDPNKIALLTEMNGICFHGAVSQDELSNVLGSAKYLLHVEAFDDESKMRTKYSLSTKIGESLESGACILAYGPQDISSMEYLVQNEAAVMLESAEEISEKIRYLNNMDTEYKGYVYRASKLAQKCHNKRINDIKILESLNVG